MPEKPMPSVSQHVFSVFSELQSVTALPESPNLIKQSENTVKLQRVEVQKGWFSGFGVIMTLKKYMREKSLGCA